MSDKRSPKFDKFEWVVLGTLLAVALVLTFGLAIHRVGWGWGILQGFLTLGITLVLVVVLNRIIDWAKRKDTRAKQENDDAERDHLAEFGLTDEERDAVHRANTHFPKSEDREQDGR